MAPKSYPASQGLACLSQHLGGNICCPVPSITPSPTPYKNHGSRAWWYMLVIPEVRRLRQEDDKFRAMTRLSLQKQKNKTNNNDQKPKADLFCFFPLSKKLTEDSCFFILSATPSPTQAPPRPHSLEVIALFIYLSLHKAALCWLHMQEQPERTEISGQKPGG